ncbi:MAG: hypothetical protein ACO3D0_04660, partial [Ilumatobacteraceae bacterium]
MARSADARAAEWIQRIVGRIRPDDMERLSRAMLSSIDQVSQHRWETAKERAAGVPGDLRPDRIAAVSAAFAFELGAAGAAAGAAAAAPMVGTAATLAATGAELAWFTGRAGDLILTIAAIHGRPDPTVDERRAWVLAVLLYGSSARDEFARTLQQASTGVLPTLDRQLPVATLQTANRIMSRMFVRRFGTRRGLVALGRALPIGIGAAIGGTANYVTVRNLARNADEFFARLPYSAIDADSTDVTGRELPRSPG